MFASLQLPHLLRNITTLMQDIKKSGRPESHCQETGFEMAIIFLLCLIIDKTKL